MSAQLILLLGVAHSECATVFVTSDGLRGWNNATRYLAMKTKFPLVPQVLCKVEWDVWGWQHITWVGWDVSGWESGQVHLVGRRVVGCDGCFGSQHFA